MSQPLAALAISFLPEFEFDRVKSTIDNLGWYRTRKYKITWPTVLTSPTDQALRALTESDIWVAIDADFDPAVYAAAEAKLKEAWSAVGPTLAAGLAATGGPVLPCYRVMLTRYGVGGSYPAADTVIVNIAYGDQRDIDEIVAHEITHLNLDSWIRTHLNGQHWEKERLIDLCMEQMFPHWARRQREPARATEIAAVFDEHYPDMETVIAKVGALTRGAA